MNLSRLNPLTLLEKITGRPMAAGTRRYFKDSIFFTAANVIPRLLSFVIQPVVTLHLTTAEYNTFGVFSNSVITILCIFLSALAESSVARYYYEGKKDFPDFLGSLFFFTAALSGVMLIQFWVFRDAWSWVFGMPKGHDSLGLTLFMWALICSVAQILHQVFLQLLLVRKLSRKYFSWNLAKNILYVIFGVYFLVRHPASGVFGLVWAFAIATLVLSVPFLVSIVRMMRPVFHWEHISYALRFSLPAIPGALASFSLNFFDRILFQHNNPDIGGQYSFAYTIGWLIQMVTTGLFSAYMPRFYENMKAGEQEKNQSLFSRNLKLLLLGGVALTVMSQPMAHLLGRQTAYWKGLPIIPIIVCGYICFYLSQCFALYISYRRKYIWVQSQGMILAAALTIAMNLWAWRIPHLVERPLMLMRFIALATLIPYFVQWLVIYAIARWMLKEKIVRFKGLILPLTLYLIFSWFWCFYGYGLVK